MSGDRKGDPVTARCVGFRWTEDSRNDTEVSLLPVRTCPYSLLFYLCAWILQVDQAVRLR